MRVTPLQSFSHPGTASSNLKSVRRWSALALAASSLLGGLLLSGCGAGLGSTTGIVSPAVAFKGHVNGGQQPVTGAQIYLYAVSQTGYATPSVSMLNSPGYVMSDTNGNFSITADYACPLAPTYVYALAIGGNPGLATGTTNSKIALLSGLGLCSSLTPATFVSINEVTTVAFAYAMAPFAASEIAIGTSSTNVPGLANAFAVLPNLVNGNGFAVLTTAAGNGTAPQANLNTLADALAACVNSTGTATACTSLFSAANVTGTNGTPVDTAQAAINIAQNPGTNVAAIYGVSTSTGPFQPTLAAAPNDWTMQITYTGGSVSTLSQVQGLAFDAAGNLYATNSTGASMTKFSPIGTPLANLTSPTMFRPQQIGIDLSGNIWTESRANPNTGTLASLIEFSSNGTLLSGTGGYTGGGLNVPRGLAIDPRGNIWAAGNSELSEFTSTGTPVSGTGGYTNSGLLSVNFAMNFDTLGNAWIPSTDANANSALVEFVPNSAAANAGGVYGGTFHTYGTTTTNYPIYVAIDAANDVWVSNVYGGSSTFGQGTGSLTEYNNAGAELSPTLGYQNGGIVQPQTIVIDGLGNVFSAQDFVGEVSKTGVAVAPSTGYASANQNDCCLAAAIDSSGGYWTSGVNYIYQWVGLAAPVVTPLVKGVVNGTLAARP